MERRRKLVCQVRAIATSDQLDFLEQFVELLYEKLPSKRP
jgi:hypothetical protein